MKKLLLSAAIMVVLGGTAAAEVLTKIAVVDIDLIATSYFGQSQTVREVTLLQEQYENERAVQQDKLDRLRELKFQADRDEDERASLQYEDQIRQQQEFMQEYYTVMMNRIKSKTSTLSQSASFAEEILKVIEYIAINEGYSMVFDARDRNIWWYSKEADITDLVIKRLQLLARSN